ncbi:hypothetical protein [Streptomyces sp. NPDC056387]|uniref:hypothetical protein n=1 Tax=Streptomyces sp. NPDC056387 TaxID=3345803 RepID=UPI0035DB1926
MAFVLSVTDRLADLLRDGSTYRVHCRRCGARLDYADRSAAEREMVIHNDLKVTCVPTR